MNVAALRNIGPKSAAWLRQVGLGNADDLMAVGPVEAFMRMRRAGFRPGLNLLYSLEGALVDCHLREIPDQRRQALVQAVETASALLQPSREGLTPAPVITIEPEHPTLASNLAPRGSDH